ncbi:MAG: DUF3185 family protein [Planctomycetota bacterium]
MSRGLAAAVLVAGAILLGFGVNASQSVGSELSKLFTGHPTDKAVWFIIGGAAGVVIGLFGMLSSRSRSRA